MLGQALILSLKNLKERGVINEKSDLPEQILSKFDKIYEEQFDQIPYLGNEKGTGFDGASLS